MSVAIFGIAIYVGIMFLPFHRGNVSLDVVKAGDPYKPTTYELRNDSTSLVTYIAYGALFWGKPIYGIERFDGAVWNYDPRGVCGVGVNRIYVPPFSSVQFEAYSPDFNTRVAVQVTKGIIFPTRELIHASEFLEVGT